MEELIKEFEKDIKDAEETLSLLRKTKQALEHKMWVDKHTPPKGTIKKALKRLGIYPKLPKNKEIELNGIKEDVEQDHEIDRIYKACSTATVDEGS